MKTKSKPKDQTLSTASKKTKVGAMVRYQHQEGSRTQMMLMLPFVSSSSHANQKNKPCPQQYGNT